MTSGAQQYAVNTVLMPRSFLFFCFIYPITDKWEGRAGSEAKAKYSLFLSLSLSLSSSWFSKDSKNPPTPKLALVIKKRLHFRFIILKQSLRHSKKYILFIQRKQILPFHTSFSLIL